MGPMKKALLFLALGWALPSFACQEAKHAPEPVAPAAAEATPAPTADRPAKASGGIDWKPAGTEQLPVADLVKAELAAASEADKTLVVYVGAVWCMPCKGFKQLVKSGRLNKQFGHVRFLEFDLDRDKQRLDKAGYSSRYIPLFVVPNADGTASERLIQGAQKGPAGVAEIVSKLGHLLGKQRS